MGNKVLLKKLTLYICTLAALLLLIFGLAYWNEAYIARVPILMYHHLAETGPPGSTISAEAFETHIKALKDAGYTAVSFDALCDYVYNGADLPEKPVVITFDDGYMSVYDTAFPILQKYNTKATVFLIGVLHGESFYKGLYYLPITPHLGDAEIIEMAASGIFSIQSHSYDMHKLVQYEPDSPRVGVTRMEHERKEDYIDALTLDFALASEQIENSIGDRPFVFSYPYGRFTRQAERVLRDAEVLVTVTTSPKINMIYRDSPNSLYRLGRFNVPGDIPPSELLAMIRG